MLLQPLRGRQPRDFGPCATWGRPGTRDARLPLALRVVRVAPTLCHGPSPAASCCLEFPAAARVLARRTSSRPSHPHLINGPSLALEKDLAPCASLSRPVFPPFLLPQDSCRSFRHTFSLSLSRPLFGICRPRSFSHLHFPFSSFKPPPNSSLDLPLPDTQPNQPCLYVAAATGADAPSKSRPGY